MEISEQIIAVMDNLGEKLGIAIDWSQENVTPYMFELMEKIVAFELWTSVMWLVIGILGIIPFIYYLRSSDKEWYKEDDGSLGTTFLVLAIVGGILTIYQLVDIITCITFQEKVIYDFLSGAITPKWWEA